MTSQIMTVLGPVTAEEIGVILPHEHLLINLHRVTMDDDQVLSDVRLAISELAQFREAGGSLVVDVTNPGMGRDAAALREISAETGVDIVMGCGWYKERFYDQDVYRKSTNQMAEELIHEINEGVDGTGVRPGIIGEIGSLHSYIMPAEERVFRAAARAHRRTGLTISTHAVGSPVGLDQLDLLEEEDVDARRVIIGHCDSYPESDYHEAIAERGAYVEFDRIQGRAEWDTQRRIGFIKELVNRGYLDHILLSHDICEKSSLHAYAGNGYDYILSGFAPRLRQAGLSEEQVRAMLVHNPKAALTGERRSAA